MRAVAGGALPAVTAVVAKALFGRGLIGGPCLHLRVLRFHALALGALQDAIVDLFARVLLIRLRVHERHLGIFTVLQLLLLHRLTGHFLDVHACEVAHMPLARHDGLDEIGVLPQCQTRSHSVRGSKALLSSQAHLRVLKVEHESPEASLVLLRNAAEFLVHPGLALLTRHADRTNGFMPSSGAQHQGEHAPVPLQRSLSQSRAVMPH